MIATISGTITHKTKQSITVIQHGIGFELLVATPEVFQIKEQVNLQTHMHWHQEQGPTLYGFHTALEKQTFLLIISCSGIGPKIALTVLQGLEPAIFLQAVHDSDIKTLSSVNGIGAKKAEQMALHLKGKVTPLLELHPEALGGSSLGVWKDLNETLNSLNYSPSEIKLATNYLKENNINSDISLDQALRKALTFLAKK